MLGRLTDEIWDLRVLGPSFLLRHLSDWAGRPHHVAKVAGAGPIQLRRGSSDALVVRQVFRHREYDLSKFPQHSRLARALDETLARGGTPVIVDGGANNGAAAVFFSIAYPRARILAVEPDPDNARICRINTRERPNITVIEAALGARSGRADLFNPQGEAWTVQTSRSETGATPIHAIDALLDTVPGAVPLIVKIDIEGFESELFDDNTGWIDRTAAVMIEPHDWLFPDRATSRSFQQAMGERDFDMLLSGENLIYIRR